MPTVQWYSQHTEHYIVQIAEIGHVFLVAVFFCEIGQRANESMISKGAALCGRLHGLCLKAAGIFCGVLRILPVLFSIHLRDKFGRRKYLPHDCPDGAWNSLILPLISQHHQMRRILHRYAVAFKYLAHRHKDVSAGEVPCPADFVPADVREMLQQIVFIEAPDFLPYLAVRFAGVLFQLRLHKAKITLVFLF